MLHAERPRYIAFIAGVIALSSIQMRTVRALHRPRSQEWCAMHPAPSFQA